MWKFPRFWLFFATRIRYIEADRDPDPTEQNETDPNESGSATLLPSFPLNFLPDADSLDIKGKKILLPLSPYSHIRLVSICIALNLDILPLFI